MLTHFSTSILIIGSLLFGSPFTTTSVFAQEQEDGLLASVRVLTVDEQQEALDFILNKTQESGYSAIGLDLETEPAVILMRDSTSVPTSRFAFSFGLNRMLQDLFADAHSRVEVDAILAEATYASLNLCLSWLHGEEPRIINSCETDSAQVGDLVTSMGGRTPADIFAMLQETIPHEQDFFLLALPQPWLVREDFLSYFGLLNDDSASVDLILARDGEQGLKDVSVSIPLALTPTDGIKPIPSFVSFEVQNETSTAVFKLDACIFNAEYMAVLEDFWSTVDANENVDTVVLDLRENRGGDFTVATAFLQYITRDPYTLFDIKQRQSDELCNQIPTLCDPQTVGFLQSLGIDMSNEVMDLPGSAMSIFLSQVAGSPSSLDLFNGTLYVLTSGVTFSSAHLFAAVIKRNNFGTLVGTPTGNTPSFGGNLLQFSVPNTDLSYYLTTSRSELNSTDVNDEDLDAIYPDILVPTTREDILAGRDAQLEYVLEMNTLNTNGTTTSTMPPTSGHSDDDISGAHSTNGGGVLFALYSISMLMIVF